MGILGRRRASKPMEVTTEGLDLLKRQLSSSDPALRLLAVEAQILAFEAKNPAPGTVVPFPAVRTTKERRNARVTGLPNNPDPKRLRWDAEKRAFRLINPTCSGSHGKSVLTGESPTCGLCDSRAVRPKRFQPGSSPVHKAPLAVIAGALAKAPFAPAARRSALASTQPTCPATQ